MSERKTEKIVRDFLSQNNYFEKDGIIKVEEQTSDFTNITKLLKGASKTGKKGKGYPEFIITSKAFPQFLIIIECKPNLKFHESKKKDKPKDYNVDGVIHYSKFLSKGFNVISFAVTGTNKKNLLISSFMQKKDKPYKVLKNSLKKEIQNFLPFDELVDIAGYDEDEAKLKLLDILAFSRSLHEFLRDYGKLSEQQKPLSICGILIALKNKNFRNNYRKLNFKEIPNFWFKSLQKEINNANIPNLKKNEIILNSFLSIRDNPAFIRPSKKFSGGVFYELINLIKDNVFPYIQVLKNYDLIGEFYNEFLKYSGGDQQSFGIVLTPKHITEFCAEILDLDHSTKVIDTCCGTGGFLIAAMQEMKKKAKSKKELKQILSHNLIGCEDMPDMFTLSVANMILRGDGKSNLYQGDSFDKKIKKSLKNHKPKYGLINPPFSQKDEDLHELSYVLNMLEILQPEGIGVVVLPMGRVTNNSEYKNQILKNHTLLAVMSLPNQLFGTKVGTVTCLAFFKAHKPHPNNFETWFGYCKDDGYYIKRHRGRNDFDNKWNNIKKKWINAYDNRSIIKDLSESFSSLTKKVTANDEWCIEPYMDTDYSKINEEDFSQVIKEFIKYKINE